MKKITLVETMNSVTIYFSEVGRPLQIIWKGDFSKLEITENAILFMMKNDMIFKKINLFNHDFEYKMNL